MRCVGSGDHHTRRHPGTRALTADFNPVQAETVRDPMSGGRAVGAGAREDGEATGNARRARSGLRILHRGGIAWICVLAITGAVQVFRQQWGDALIFGIAAILVLLTAVGAVPALDWLRTPPLAVVVIGALAAAATVALVPRHTLLAGCCCR